jgi:hypothetical protein
VPKVPKVRRFSTFFHLFPLKTLALLALLVSGIPPAPHSPQKSTSLLNTQKSSSSSSESTSDLVTVSELEEESAQKDAWSLRLPDDAPVLSITVVNGYHRANFSSSDSDSPDHVVYRSGWRTPFAISCSLNFSLFAVIHNFASAMQPAIERKASH